jgi:phosphopantothenoylcysteine decarboxylase / phosphopantothenate---cysteine ligase
LVVNAAIAFVQAFSLALSTLASVEASPAEPDELLELPPLLLLPAPLDELPEVLPLLLVLPASDEPEEPPSSADCRKSAVELSAQCVEDAVTTARETAASRRSEFFGRFVTASGSLFSTMRDKVPRSMGMKKARSRSGTREQSLKDSLTSRNDSMGTLRGKTIVLAVTGSIAAYKAPMVARLLIAKGARVIPLMTASATKFLGAETLSGLTNEPVHTDMWQSLHHGGELHVQLAAKADAIVIVPATADTMARIAGGQASDLLSALLLSRREIPVLLAPSMHPRMWAAAATKRNVATLTRDGIIMVGPVNGPVASGDIGEGRMAEPEAVAWATEKALATKDLAGKRILLAFGPTHEPMDPVRFLGNRSSGTMGLALFENAVMRGAEVFAVVGPSVTLPSWVSLNSVTRVMTAEEMASAVFNEAAKGFDAIVMAAAVADFRPSVRADRKIKKTDGEGPQTKPMGAKPTIVVKTNGDYTLELVQNTDILATLGALRAAGRLRDQASVTKGKPVAMSSREVRVVPAGLSAALQKTTLIGFALETGTPKEVRGYAEGKLKKKQVDMVVANEASAALGTLTNHVCIVHRDGSSVDASGDKSTVATAIWDEVLRAY